VAGVAAQADAAAPRVVAAMGAVAMPVMLRDAAQQQLHHHQLQRRRMPFRIFPSIQMLCLFLPQRGVVVQVAVEVVADAVAEAAEEEMPQS
jgi:hypothetical protein